MSWFKKQFPYNQKQRQIYLSTLWECLAWPIGPPYKRGQPGPALHRDDAIGDPGDLGDAIGDWLRLSRRLYSEPWTQSSLCKGDDNSGQGWPVFIQQSPKLSQQQNKKNWFSLYEYIFRECVLKRWFSWAAMVWMTMTMVAVMIPELILTRIGKVDIWAHVRCDLVMWGVRGRDPFVHKSVTARLGWSRSNIMFVVLNQILHHWVGFETKKTPQQWTILGMQLESFFWSQCIFSWLSDLSYLDCVCICVFVFAY